MRGFFTWQTFDAASGWAAETVGDATQLTSPAARPAAPFEQAVPSWCAATPPGSWVEVYMRAQLGERWSNFYQVARWDAAATASVRTSFDDQRDADGRVATDTVVLAAPAGAMQLRVLLHGGAAGMPALARVSVALSGPGDAPALHSALSAIELAVPPRAQLDYPYGPNICSPTALSMLLAYWQARTADPALLPFAERRAVAEIATPQVYDPAYDGHGNWPFNTALAGGLGLDAYVARFASLAELVPWLEAGVPLAISAAWEPGTLDNAPIPRSLGHLLVLAGFDGAGHAIVADPRGNTEAEVRRLYDAAQLERAWQDKPSGTAYVIHPRGWPVPALA